MKIVAQTRFAFHMFSLVNAFQSHMNRFCLKQERLSVKQSFVDGLANKTIDRDTDWKLQEG